MLNAKTMKLIVGLGNPGEKYKSTRHNIGANVAKELAKSNNISLRKRKYLSRFGEGKICGEEVNIILPLTYMNLSGKAIYSIVKDKDIPFSDILIICDDADLNLGNIRIRPKGSDGGHRGLRSIIENLQTQSFPRLRIGIGKNGNLANHVLKSFDKDEANRVEGIKERAVETILCWIKQGVTGAMNTYNTKSKELK
jgi:PTH1 family peptidyl-tRNA hydrolase